MKLALHGGKIITPFRIVNKGTLTIEGNKISGLLKSADSNSLLEYKIIDVSGKIISPGFSDLLVHGGSGFGFSDDLGESIEKIGSYFLKHGSTTILASLFAKPEKLLLRDLKRLAGFIEEHPDSNIKGIHMEGPYLNKKFKGAMNENYLWKPGLDSWKKIWEASRGFIRIMTIAPEIPGALRVMQEAAKCGVVLSIGHSMASYDEVEDAIDNGAAHVTHIFNAMQPFHHRNPGIILGSLLHNELKIELIADTLHVHPAVMQLLLKLKGANGIILVSDSIRAGGMHEGEYEFADQKIFLKGKKAYLKDGTLAGSTLTLNLAVKNMVEEAGAKITEAVRMASLNGLKVLGLSHKKGILAAGKDADIVVFNENYEVEMTILNGKIVYDKNEIN
ncbi:MAG TPA: N-acetylglucosamine-6-phosphate deacetylase [Ignavibacteriaceae bacterium]|nr:N-acetylglucosamine-6-phosphate deacetylase [Ignavibacteriaceae bacterium]